MVTFNFKNNYKFITTDENETATVASAVIDNFQ